MIAPFFCLKCVLRVELHESINMDKKLAMLFMVVGSTIGGYAPVLFGAESFSFTAVLTSMLGGILGIWLALKFFSA